MNLGEYEVYVLKSLKLVKRGEVFEREKKKHKWDYEYRLDFICLQFSPVINNIVRPISGSIKFLKKCI